MRLPRIQCPESMPLHGRGKFQLYFIDIEVLDKRHVGLILTNMEKQAIKSSHLQQDVEVDDLLTNASTSVKAFLGKVIVICIFVFFRYQFLNKRINEVGY